MSKELPEGLRPKPVLMSDGQQVRECTRYLLDAVKNGRSWFYADSQPDGTVTSIGRYTAKEAAFLALSAMQGWADAAELEGDMLPTKLLEDMFRRLGATKEYISGGVIPERRVR